jgi:alpha-ketoglutarate-dependent taurine dioxygenase
VSRPRPPLARRRSVSASAESLVRTSPHLSDHHLPLRIEPTVDGLELAGWARENRARIGQLLADHRALVFRGFGVDRVGDFEEFIAATSDGPKLEYVDRTTPREDRGERVYTATVYPPDQTIALHNEGAYWTTWARKLYFCCLVAPKEGGETPLADVRRVHDRLDTDLQERFRARGWMLVRNYNDGFGLTWQDVFQAEARSDVEAYCRDHDIEWEWKDGDRLRTRQVRPAIRTHPDTGESVWFNHAIFYHWTSLDPAVRDTLVRDLGMDGLPYSTFYGDGEPIEAEVAEHVRDAYLAEKIVFPWRRGDVTLLDNMSVAHARQPFVGDREIIVAMTEAYSPDAAASGVGS